VLFVLQLRAWFELRDAMQVDSTETGFVAHRTKHPGNSAITIRDDGKVCAVGGWDGKCVFIAEVLTTSLTYHPIRPGSDFILQKQ
jgi:hypothetical protein